MTIVASNSLTLSKVNDGTITHVAWSWSADGTDGFTTVYPNLNLLDGAKDFSGDWISLNDWTTDGTYKGLTVKKRTGKGTGFYKVYTVTADDTYTFSSYLKSSVNGVIVKRWVNTNGKDGTGTIEFTSNFDWMIDTFSASLKAGDKVFVRYEIASDGTGLDIWNAGHKWEHGSTATPWIPSASEVKPADYPSYRGEYSDFSSTASTDPQKYSWGLIRENSPYTYTAYANSADGTDGFTTVYPNSNLLNFNSGVTFGKHYGWAANITSFSGNRAMFRKVKVTPGAQYTISANWSNTAWLNVYAFANESDTVAIARYGSIDGKGTGSWDSNFVGGYTAANNMTFTVPANVNYIGVSYTSISTDTLTLQAILNGKPKLEQGSTATPWTPAPSEDPLGVIPKYVGTAALPYDSYDKYEWKINVDWINQFNLNQQSEIINAQNAADRANASISDMSKDSILTPIEKRKLLVDWTSIQSEYSKLVANANKFGVSTTAYIGTYSVLGGYILSLISDLTVNSTIVANTFKTNFKNYYDAKVDLMNNTNLAIQANMDALGTNTAYSYSIDGTDRFTTVYPNLNLLEGSKKYTKDNPKIVSSNASDNGVYMFDVSAKNLKAGTYTMSGKADASWTIHATNDANRKGKVGLWLISTTPGLNVNISLGDTVPKTIIVPKDGDYIVMVNTYSNGTDVVTHKFWDFKLEPGSTATPLMPSEKELTSDDIPKYVGYSVRQSENPKDFSWQPYGGLNSYKITEAKTSIEQNSKDIALKANKLEVDTLSGRVLATESSLKIQDGKITALNTKADGHTTQIGTLESSYNGLTSTISKIQTDVGGKAGKTELSQLSQDLSGFKTTVANTYADKVSVASQINQSATAVTSNVQSWTNNKLTAYSTTQQTATSITNAVASKADKSQITQLSNQITSVVTDISAIQVGGQNLLLGTATAKTSTITQTNSYTTIAPYNFSMSKLSAFNFKVDDYITLSFDWETTSTTGDTKIETNSTPYGFGTVISAKGTNGATSITKTITASEQRGRIEIVFKVSSTSKVSEATKFRLRFDNHQLNSTFTIKNAKLEKGNKATDWCMAPQEVANQSQITQLSDNINLKVSKGGVISSINQEAGQIVFNANKLVLNANTTEITGNAFIRGDMIVDGSIKADKLEVNNLAAISANIGKISNTFDNSSGGIDNKGKITIADSVKAVYYQGNSSTTVELVARSNGRGLFTENLADKTDATKYQQSWYGPSGLYLWDTTNNWYGEITAENVTLVPWTNITYLPGFTTAENNPCQYRKIKNLDGSYTVQFRGQIKPSSGSFAVNSTSYVASIPIDVMPSKNAFGIGIPDFNTIQNVRLVVVADLSSNPRQLQIKVTGGVTSYVSLDMLSYTI